jgi:hypothetical protein
MCVNVGPLKPFVALLFVGMKKPECRNTPVKIIFLRFYFAISDMFLDIARYVIILDKAQIHGVV